METMIERKVQALLFIGVFAALGCDRYYHVNGELVLNPTAAATSTTPAVLCTGRGGPPESSGMYAHPVANEQSGIRGYVLCRRPSEVTKVPYKEGVLYGSIPRQMHIYAFVEPAPDAQELCDRQPNVAIIPVREQGWTGYRRCYDRRLPSKDMRFVVTYDDGKAKTWTEGPGGWFEQRDIVLR
jgi:hypothetical protein